MIRGRILRDSENASSTRKVNKPGDSEPKLPRMKAKALGDVQNTLHSRPENFMNFNVNSTVKALKKTSIHSKSSKKSTAGEKNINVTPMKSSKTLHSSTSEKNNEMFEIHNHVLCEKGHQAFVNDYLADYKFSEEQLTNLTSSVKNFVTPFRIQYFKPCEDIEIPTMEKFEKSIFSVSDIFTDLVVPQVPAPLEAL